MTHSQLTDVVYRRYVRDLDTAASIADEALAKGGTKRELFVAAGRIAVSRPHSGESEREAAERLNVTRHQLRRLRETAN